MLGWLDSDWLRIAAYLAAALAALFAGWSELRQVRKANLWPTFWFLTAGLLFLMAVGRASDLGGWVSELGRREALYGGWYDHRRKFQAMAVGSVGAIWLVVVVVALWRVPERRRRCLPAAVVVFTFMCFAGVRVVSLHQIDGLLYRRYLAGVKIDALVELALLLLAIGVTLWQPQPSPPRRPPAPPALVDADRNRGLS